MWAVSACQSIGHFAQCGVEPRRGILFLAREDDAPKKEEAVMVLMRLARPEDAPALQAIYAPVVATTAISFELAPPTVAEMAERVQATQTRWPWLVAEADGTPIGYAYASRHRERAAYQWSVDVSAYIHEQWRGQGVGRALYTALFALLRAQGYINVYAGIALPNPGSVGLHEAMGLRPVGIYQRVGFKLGAWHDVGWWQGALLPHPDDPPLPIALSDLLAQPGWEQHLAVVG
jgi:L-amino acid N-acyltransferase YncA